MKRLLSAALIHFALPSLLFSATEATIFYGNGVRSTAEDAEYAKKVLEQAVREDSRFSAYTLFFDLVYNQTDCIPENSPGADLGCIGDLFEAFRQLRRPEDPSLFWTLEAGLPVDDAALQESFYRIGGETTNPLPSPSQLSMDITEHLEKYRDELRSKRVILVAHSQGNLFGNDAYRSLSDSQKRSFGMVSVATPADNVLGNFDSQTAPYTTLGEDPIRRWYIPFPTLPWNVTNGGSIEDPEWRFHAFADSYLAGSESKEKVLDLIKTVLDSLADPSEPTPPPTPDTVVLLDSFFDRLLILDPVTGQSRSLMLLSHDFLSGLAYDRESGLLYSVDGDTNELVEIYLQNGRERSVVIVGINNVHDITFGPEGVLYGVATGLFSTSQLVRIDTQAGHGVSVGGIVSGQFSGLVYDPDSDQMYATKSFANGFFQVSPFSGTFTPLIPGFGAGVVQMAEIPGSTEIFAVGNSRSASLVAKLDPAAPVFSTFARFSPVRSITGVEMVSLQGVSVPSNQHAVIGLLDSDSPNVIADLSTTILWMDDDPDDDAMISLGYSPDPSCVGATSIASGLSEDDEHDQYVWNTSAVPEGRYYVLAMITDGVNQTVSDCSRWTVTIDHVGLP